MPAPRVPDNDAEGLVRALVAVDLSGGASTAANDQMTVGHASKAKAILGGTGVGSPSSRAAPTLIEKYLQMRQLQAEAAEKAAKAGVGSPEDVEGRALKRSRKRLRRHLQEGISPAVAVTAAHAHYKKHGGRSSFAVWSKKVATGA